MEILSHRPLIIKMEFLFLHLEKSKKVRNTNEIGLCSLSVGVICISKSQKYFPNNKLCAQLQFDKLWFHIVVISPAFFLRITLFIKDGTHKEPLDFQL